MPTNEYLPFCPTSTGTNLPTQSAYAADANRTSGNQPGVASSTLNNKALRQANAVASQVAQFMVNNLGVDVLDDGDSTKMLGIITANFMRLAPVVTKITSTTPGTFYNTYYFFVNAGSATAGATYTNNTKTFTVITTIAAGTLLSCTGTGAPSVSGTLTKASGTGDATITFYAMRAPLAMRVMALGAGGGGAGSGTAGTMGSGGAGGNTTFGGTLVVCNGGTGAATNATAGSGGSTSLGAGVVGFGVTGAAGGGGQYTSGGTPAISGGGGGSTALGGAGNGGSVNNVGGNASANSGSGGGGANSGTTGAVYSGGGGGAGGYADALISNPVSSYAYAVGAKGAKGTAGTSGFAGGDAADGMILLEEFYQ